MCMVDRVTVHGAKGDNKRYTQKDIFAMYTTGIYIQNRAQFRI